MTDHDSGSCTHVTGVSQVKQTNFRLKRLRNSDSIDGNILTSIISPKSGSVMATGLKRDLRLSGSSTLPAYPGFMVMKKPQVGFTRISCPSNTHLVGISAF